MILPLDFKKSDHFRNLIGSERAQCSGSTVADQVKHDSLELCFRSGLGYHTRQTGQVDSMMSAASVMRGA